MHGHASWRAIARARAPEVVWDSRGDIYPRLLRELRGTLRVLARNSCILSAIGGMAQIVNFRDACPRKRAFQRKAMHGIAQLGRARPGSAELCSNT